MSPSLTTRLLARSLTESWEEFDALRKAGHFSKAVKTGPLHDGTGHDSPGRGPHGELRNFHAMGPAKLAETLQALAVHGEDHEAHLAAMHVAAAKLGIEPTMLPKMKSGQNELVAAWVQESWEQWDELHRGAGRMRANAGERITRLRNSDIRGGLPERPTLDQAERAVALAAGHGQRRLEVPVPEGHVSMEPVGRSPVGIQTFHVAGGGAHQVAELRRGNRNVSGLKAARREVAERLHNTMVADADHTDRLARRLKRRGAVRVSPVNRGSHAAIIRGDDGKYHVRYADKDMAGSAHADPREAVKAAKQAFRDRGDQFLNLEHNDPLSDEKRALSALEHHQAHKHSVVERAREQIKDMHAEVGTPKDVAKEQIAATVGLPSKTTILTDPSEALRTLSDTFHSLVPHMAAAMPHVASAHAAMMSHAHLVTQVVQARVDDEERRLAEAVRSGSGSQVAVARARLVAARGRVPERDAVWSPELAEAWSDAARAAALIARRRNAQERQGVGDRAWMKEMRRLAREHNFEGLHDEWARLDRALLPYAGNPQNPVSRRLIDQQLALTHLLHHANRRPGRSLNKKGQPRDVVVVGSGPAGLSAAIYGATEGLDTVMVDKERSGQQGGQIRFSSRVENVLGYPAGVTGSELARTSLEQAQRVGAETKFGREVTGMSFDPRTGLKHLTFKDGSSVDTRAVVIAGGLRFKKVDFKSQGGEFTGENLPGVVYADSKALKATPGEKVIVGGANSAGQAALDTATEAKHVTILARSGIRKGMSDYLVRQLENDPNITIKQDAIDHVNRGKDGHVQSVTLKDGTVVPCNGIGVFVGSGPDTDWVTADRDEHGYINANPATLETSVPGVYAAGDVRSGTDHRVIIAAADGAHAIASVHRYLAAEQAKETQEADMDDTPGDDDDAADEFMQNMVAFDRVSPWTGVERRHKPKKLREAWSEQAREAALIVRRRKAWFRRGMTGSAHHQRFDQAVKKSGSLTDLFGGDGHPENTQELFTDGNGHYSAARAQLHQRILDELFAGHSPKPKGKRTVLLLAGGSAAGKSSLVKAGKITAPDDAVHVDADRIKELLPEWGPMVDAKDPRVARIVHDESSDIANAAFDRAVKEGYNVTMDGTGKGVSHPARIDQAFAAGHRVHVATVGKDIDQALADAHKRAGHSGRVVPDEIIHESHAGVSKTFLSGVLPRAKKIDSLEVFDNTDYAGKLIAHLTADKRLRVDDRVRYKAFLDRRNHKS